MRTISFHAMGCRMSAALDAEMDPYGTLMSVPEWFEKWEQALSRFRPESDLQRLNLAHGKPIAVGDTLLEALEAARQSAEETDGMIHPLLLNAMEAAGYDRSFEDIPSETDGPADRPALADWRAIQLDRRAGVAQLPANGRVDLGGTAKGWAADRAIERLQLIGPALVDAGGDIAVSGMRTDGTPWPISVENPFDAEHDFCLLAMCGGGLATSGRDYRVWMRGGEQQHHILDPRSGRPARTDVLTATVAAPTARQAEAAAKMALILGREAGLRWIEAREDLAALLILEDGSYFMSARMLEMRWEGMLV
jgi:thiamine biosynthesis lipoprotein